MAKAKKRRNSQKKAAKKQQKKLVVTQQSDEQVIEAVESDVFEPEETLQSVEKRTDWRAVIVIALAGLVLLAAGLFIWNTLKTPPAPSETPRPTSVIPLEGSANPEQLQSGSAPVQNGSGVDGSDNSASDALQPQDSLTPEQFRNLQ